MSPPPVLTPAEKDALIRYRAGVSGGHVESLSLKLNLPEGRALCLKVTLLDRLIGRRDAVAEAWAIAFDLGPERGAHVALKQTWPYAAATIHQDCLYARLGGVELRQGRAVGELEDEATGARVSWDLTFTTEHEGYRHFPGAWMYEAPVPKTKVCSPQVDSRFDGVVTVCGDETRIRDAPGMLGHSWGRQRSELWTWAHCNLWQGDGQIGVFEGLAARTRVGPLTTPLLTMLHVRLPGERIDLNGYRDLVRTRSAPDGLSWSFEGTRGDRRVRGCFRGPAERFVGVDYHDPDGRVAHCLNSKIADGELTVEARRRGRWEPLARAVADRSAALEIGSRGGTFGVPIRIR